MKHILYHANCCDGFTAAWLLARVYGENNHFVAMNYGDPFPEIKDDGEIFIVDFNIEIPEHISNSVTVFDHHIGAQALFQKQYERMTKWSKFDTEQSGASLVYQFIARTAIRQRHLVDAEKLVNYVKDRDLWIWALPGSEEINALISNNPKTFNHWDVLSDLIDSDYFKARMLGFEIVRCHDNIINRTKSVKKGNITFVNSACLQSEVGDHYGPGTVVVWYYDGSKVRCSVRGEGALELAKSWGGGGHKLAAGFNCGIAEFVDWMEKYCGT